MLYRSVEWYAHKFVLHRRSAGDHLFRTIDFQKRPNRIAIRWQGRRESMSRTRLRVFGGMSYHRYLKRLAILISLRFQDRRTLYVQVESCRNRYFHWWGIGHKYDRIHRCWNHIHHWHRPGHSRPIVFDRHRRDHGL